MNLQFKTSPVELKGSVAPWLATRKKSVTIRLARTVQVGGFDTRWDGGSRTEYSAYQIGRNVAYQLPQGGGTDFHPEATTFTIPKDIAVLIGGVFQGKESTPRIIVGNAHDFADFVRFKKGVLSDGFGYGSEAALPLTADDIVLLEKAFGNDRATDLLLGQRLDMVMAEVSRAREGRDRGSISGFKTSRCGPVCKTVLAVWGLFVASKFLKKP